MTDNTKKNGEFPSDIHNTIKGFISETTEKSLNLVVNISGVYLDKDKRKQFREQVKQEIAPEYEKFIMKNILLGQKIVKEIQRKKITGVYVKEIIYRFFDNMRYLSDDIPEDVNVFDYLLSALKESKGVRFNLSYLENTKYDDYVVMIENLLERIDEEGNMGSAGQHIWNFIYTNDAYALVQSAFQRMPDYYLFLEREHKAIKKEQVNKYLEIYDDLAGHFEKLVYLVVGLVKTLREDSTPDYEQIKKRRLYHNLMFLNRSGYGDLISGFDRHIRNALAHKTYKIDLVNEIVIFYDVGYEIEKKFIEFQKDTRELSANLLVLPNLFILIFYLAISRFKEAIDKLE